MSLWSFVNPLGVSFSVCAPQHVDTDMTVPFQKTWNLMEMGGVGVPQPKQPCFLRKVALVVGSAPVRP